MSFSTWYMTVMLKAPFLILLSVVPLVQLNVILGYIAMAAAKQPNNYLLTEVLRDCVSMLGPPLTKIFGKVDEFTFNLYHVLLTAILIVMIMNRAGS